MYSDERRYGFLSLAKSLLAQISKADRSILDLIDKEAAKSTDVVLSSTDTAMDLLKLALQICKKTYIVLDGIDEFSREDRKQIAVRFQRLISDIPSEDFGSTRCLFVSQSDGPARKDFGHLSSIHITRNDVDDDIRAFCRRWQENIGERFGQEVPKQYDIENFVTEGSEGELMPDARSPNLTTRLGMFLFAKLVMDNLYEQTSKLDLEREMDPKIFPKGLDGA